MVLLKCTTIASSNNGSMPPVATTLLGFFDILRVRHETSCKRSFAWLEPEQYEYSLHTNVISAGSFGSHLSIGNIIFVAHCRPKAIVTVHEYDKLGNGNLACIWLDKPY